MRRDLTVWRPHQIPEPVLDPNIGEHGAIERVAEIYRYHLLRVEFALSPSGVLREVLKRCLRILLLLCVPAFMIIPALVVIAAGLADLAAEVVRMCFNALKAVLTLAAAAVVCSAVRSWLSARRR